MNIAGIHYSFYLKIKLIIFNSTGCRKSKIEKGLIKLSFNLLHILRLNKFLF